MQGTIQQAQEALQQALKAHPQFRLGLDYHGVISTFPEEFSAITQQLILSGHEVHILTGSLDTSEIRAKIAGLGIKYTHFFSIPSYHKVLGTKMWFKDPENPYLEALLWDKTKAEYCLRNKIDLHIDDSPEYGKYFSTPYFLLA